MAVLGIHHVSIAVPDLAKAIDFYSRVLGFVVVQEMQIDAKPEMCEFTGLADPTAKIALLKAGWGYLKVIEFEEPHSEHQYFWTPVNALGHRHIGLSTGDAMRFYNRTRDEIRWHDFPVSHTVEDGNEAWADYGRDPFGNVIELWTQGSADPMPHGPDTHPYPGAAGAGASKIADTANDVFALHHAAMVFPDLDKGTDYYCELFDLEKVQYGPIEPAEYAERVCQLPKVEAVGWELRSGWMYLEVWEFKHPISPAMEGPSPAYNQPGLNAICFMVDDCDLEYERLKERVTFHSRPIDYGHGRAMMGRDLFGNVLEFWELGAEDPQPFEPAIIPFAA